MQRDKGTFRGKPKGLLRLFLRAPIWLYRLGLGWLLGDRFLLLTHTGRKSGLPRRTVLEVVRHDKAAGLYVIASGWGEKADWLLNIQKSPRVTVQSGWEQQAAVAVRLTPEEGRLELLDYARRHPAAFRVLAAKFLGEPPSDIEPACSLLAQTFPLIALRPGQSGA